MEEVVGAVGTKDAPLDDKGAAAREEGVWAQLRGQGKMAGRMLSSKCVWAITVCHWCSGVGAYIGLAWFPTYFSTVWGVPRAQLGLTVLPCK